MKVSLATRTGPVVVDAVKPVPGLAVNHELRGATAHDLGKWYTVTHVSSGLKLPGVFKLRRDAVAYCHRLAPLADWTKSKTQLQAVAGLGQRCQEESRK